MKSVVKKLVSVVAMAAMVLSTVLMPFAGTSLKANAAGSAITSSDFIKANGKVLRKNYGTGDTVVLRGTNAGGYLVQEFWMTPTSVSSGVSCEMDIYTMLTNRFGEASMRSLVKTYQDNYWTEKDFDNCAALGINCIRLPFWYLNFVDFNGNYLDGCFDRIDWFIEQAGKRGMYVILDFHGAPGSQNGSDHSGVDGGNDKLGASQFFFGSNAYNNQQLYYDIWYKIATRYKDNPVVAGYDLLNEPYCTYRYSSSYSADTLHSMLWSVYDIAYDVIRSVDKNHVIIMEATWDPVDLPNPSTYGWENVMYEYHNYNYGDYDNAAGEQISNMQNKLNKITEANYNVPSYMGEFCYFNNTSAWTQGLKLLNDYGINWTTWTYKVISDYGNWGLYNQSVPSTNVTTDSYNTILNNWSQVGSSYKNTTLCNAIQSYFTAGTGSQSSSSSSSSTATLASIPDGAYYFKAVDSGKVVSALNSGNSPLNAAYSAYGGSWETIHIVNNSDGTVSFKSDVNNKYVCAVIDENNQLLARSASIGTWEKYYIYQVTDTQFAIKAYANGKYVKDDQNNGNELRASADSISGWEVFTLYKTNGTQVTKSSLSTSSSSASTTVLANGEYYFKDYAGKVVCAENTGTSPLVANRDSYGGAWETLTVVNNSDGTISLKSGANGKYVCAVIDEDNQLLARSASIGTWEKFYVEKTSDGKFALKAYANGKYVCADQNKSSVLYADRDTVGGWESFTIYTTSGNKVN